VYEPTHQSHNGKPLFQKQGDPDKWLRFNVNNMWAMSSTASKDANNSDCWCHSVEADIEHPTEVKSWTIYFNGSEWEVHAGMKCVAWSEYRSSPVLIGGVVGKKANVLNGVYEPTRQLHNGKPLFQKQGDPDKWLRFDVKKLWLFCATANKDANNSVSWCHSVETDIEHPTKVKNWTIYDRSENKWEVHAAMKCTTITQVQQTWHKYCIVYARIATGALLFGVLIFWLEFVAPRRCSMNLNSESCQALRMCSWTEADFTNAFCYISSLLRGRGHPLKLGTCSMSLTKDFLWSVLGLGVLLYMVYKVCYKVLEFCCEEEAQLKRQQARAEEEEKARHKNLIEKEKSLHHAQQLLARGRFPRPTHWTPSTGPANADGVLTLIPVQDKSVLACLEEHLEGTDIGVGGADQQQRGRYSRLKLKRA
jgi:hypothetical protein